MITETTKLAPGEIAPTLGRAIRWLYGRLRELKGQERMRFSEWFALHLSNFGFTYKWEEWCVPRYPLSLPSRLKLLFSLSGFLLACL